MLLASLIILGPSYGTPTPGWDTHVVKGKGMRELLRIQILHKISSRICYYVTSNSVSQRKSHGQQDGEIHSSQVESEYLMSSNIIYLSLFSSSRPLVSLYTKCTHLHCRKGRYPKVASNHGTRVQIQHVMVIPIYNLNVP